jgi:hypothetical protein
MSQMLFNLIKGTEVTLVTKKTRKEFKVFVSDIWNDGKIFVGWYTNRFGELAIKHFDMTQYDYYL